MSRRGGYELPPSFPPNHPCPGSGRRIAPRNQLMHLKITLEIDDSLLALAGEYTGETEKTALVRMGLEALVEREAARRLAALGAHMPSLEIPKRTRSEKAHQA